MAIISSSKWEDALRNTTETRSVTTTPLRKLIRKMPEVAKEVFNKCTVTNAEKNGKVLIIRPVWATRTNVPDTPMLMCVMCCFPVYNRVVSQATAAYM